MHNITEQSIIACSGVQVAYHYDYNFALWYMHTITVMTQSFTF